MSAREIAEAFTAALDAGDFDTAASYLADNFQFSGTMMPEALGAQQWLGMSMALRAGIPDMSYNFTLHESDESSVRVSSRISGTHTQDLDMTGMGMGVVAPTGVAFTCGEEFSVGRVEGGKVTSIHLEQSPNSGLMDLFQQLGIQPSQM
jgi:hypothetical protein